VRHRQRERDGGVGEVRELPAHELEEAAECARVHADGAGELNLLHEGGWVVCDQRRMALRGSVGGAGYE
jgi:hypothetical protein